MSDTPTTMAKYKPEDFKRPVNLTVLKGMGDMVKSAVADAMPGFLRGQAPALLRALYTECQKQPALLNCTPESLFGATIQAAQMGLMLGGALGQCYLIPFKGRVTLVPGYKGYIQLVNRSGQVGVISARTVYDKDTFRVELGTEEKIVHIRGDYPTLDSVRARKAVAYYATCKTKSGSTFASMTLAEAEYHRDRFALAQKGPWKDHFDAMAMKTCIIKLCKYLPMSAELQTAIHIDEMDEHGEPVDCSFMFADATGIEDAPAPSKTDALRDRLNQTTAPATPPAKPDGRPILLQLLDQFEAAGGSVADLLGEMNATEDDLRAARHHHADKYAATIRAAIAGRKGGA